MLPPPNGTPHKMVDSTPFSNEHKRESYKCKYNFSCSYLFYCI